MVETQGTANLFLSDSFYRDSWKCVLKSKELASSIRGTALRGVSYFGVVKGNPHYEVPLCYSFGEIVLTVLQERRWVYVWNLLLGETMNLSDLLKWQCTHTGRLVS